MLAKQDHSIHQRPVVFVFAVLHTWQGITHCRLLQQQQAIKEVEHPQQLQLVQSNFLRFLHVVELLHHRVPMMQFRFLLSFGLPFFSEFFSSELSFLALYIVVIYYFLIIHYS
jgi:hypothetical protein